MMTMIPGRLYQSTIRFQAFKRNPDAPNQLERTYFEVGYIMLLLSVSPWRRSYDNEAIGSIYEFFDQNGDVYRVYDNHFEFERKTEPFEELK